ncbi:MAG TPA: IclR family transcriptional regulator [Chloroflexota bacterium]|nr:IclR family transcriptional regulator [Chloroflexota bacterium]
MRQRIRRVDKVVVNIAFAKQVTPSVAKAFRILECFSERRPRLTFAELAEQVDLPPTTLRRLLATLESLDYVQHDPLGLYRLGPRALALSPAALAGYDVRNQALPVLDDLAILTSLNANLGTLYQGRLLYLACVSHNVTRRIFSVPGRLAMAHCTALGKVMLASRPLDEVPSIVALAGGLVKRTVHTRTTWEDLEAELAQVRERGYAVDDEEVAIGSRCIAAPVRGQSGEVIAALGVNGTTEEIERDRIPELISVVRQSAETLSYKLGAAFAREW